MKITASVTAKPAVPADKDGKGAKPARVARETSVEYNVPEKLQDQVAAFTDVVVAAAAQDSIVISLQAFMRGMMIKGKSDAEIAAAVKTWRPSVRNVVKQTAFEKVSSNLTALTKEERAKLIEELRKAA